MTGVADLLRAISDLLWPLFAAGVVLVFRKPLAEAIGRVKRAKGPGWEVELEEDLQQAQAASDLAAYRLPAVVEVDAESTADRRDRAEFVEEILSEASDSPKAALMLLASRIEQEIREVAGSRGILESTSRPHITSIATDVFRQAGLPQELAEATRRFWEVRNKIVHGRATDPDQVLWALDIGLSVLRTLQAVPREVNTVYHPGVPVYADKDGREVRKGIHGVILETKSVAGDPASRRIFPSTKNWFRPGEPVTWEWYPKRVIPESWYRDPESGKIEYAWTTSQEFIGRHYDDL
ncbi:MAG: hypothetical protein ACYCX3_11880 [Thermoleophilia bacterium]